MITPRFSLTQDEIFLIIKIRAPYCSLRDLETYIEGNDFRFVCPPYYLRLNLPGNIIDNDLSTGNFDSDKGEFEFKFTKETKSEHFEGLNFITSLLAPKIKKSEPEIEVLNTENTGDENDWHIAQNLPTLEENALLNGYKCGFANQKSQKNTGFFENEFSSVLDIRNVENTSLTDRQNQKHDTESMQFSQDHYLADYFENDEIKYLIAQQAPWKLDSVHFSSQDIDILKDFPNKEYLLSNEEKRIVFLGLVDILYAFCYDQRTTNFEGSCESGWTISKLSSTLSWFHVFKNESEVIKACFRRSSIYPLYRNFELCNRIFEDLKYILSLGEVFIVKCLLQIYNYFNASAEPRYILNDLYIKDYIIYMQKCDKEIFKNVIENINQVTIQEEDLELNYKETKKIIDTYENKNSEITEKLLNLNIASDSDSDDSDSDTDSSSSCEDSSD